jgi:Bacterial SH3 domain
LLEQTSNPETGHPWYRISVWGLQGYVDAEKIASVCGTDQRERSESAYMCNSGAPFTNMRSGPNARQYGVVLKLKNHRKVQILDLVTNPESGQPWFKIKAGKRTGFVDSDMVKESCG